MTCEIIPQSGLAYTAAEATEGFAAFTEPDQAPFDWTTIPFQVCVSGTYQDGARTIVAPRTCKLEQ